MNQANTDAQHISTSNFVGIIVLIIALLVTISLILDIFKYQPLIINQTVGDASIVLQAHRDSVLFQGDCLDIQWQVDGIRSIYLNNEATIGAFETRMCLSLPKFQIDFVDGTSQTYSLRPTVLIQTDSFQARLALLAVCILVAIGAFGCFGKFSDFKPNTRTFWASIKRFLSDVQTSGKHHLMLLSLTLLVSLGLRVWLLQRELAIDEVETFMRYTWDWHNVISNYSMPNNHILNTIFVFAERQVFGFWAAGFRLHNLVAGMLVVLMSYVMGRSFYNKSVGLFTAALVGLSSIMVTYSAQARGYMLQCFFTLALVLLGHYLIKRDNLVAWLLWVICSALCFYTLPTSVFVYAGVAAWVALNFLMQANAIQRIIRLIAYSVAAGMLTIFLYMPVLLHMGIAAITANPTIQDAGDIPNVAQAIQVALIEIIQLWTYTWHPILIVISGIALLIGIIAPLFSPMRTRLTLLFSFIVMDVILVMLTAIPFGRVWTFLVPIVAMQVAFGFVWSIERIRITRPAPLLPLSLCVLLVVVSINQTYGNLDTITTRQYHQITDYFADNLTSPDEVRIISYYPSTAIMAFYFSRESLDLSYLSFDRADLERYYLVTYANQTPMSILSERTRIDIENTIWTLLTTFGDLQVYELETPLPMR